MAKKYDNDKGFLIIEMSLSEATIDCNFGIVCDNCNNLLIGENSVYYFAALNRLFCKECTDDIIANQERYPDDIPYEVRHYNYYAKILNLPAV